MTVDNIEWIYYSVIVIAVIVFVALRHRER